MRIGRADVELAKVIPDEEVVESSNSSGFGLSGDKFGMVIGWGMVVFSSPRTSELRPFRAESMVIEVLTGLFR